MHGAGGLEPRSAASGSNSHAGPAPTRTHLGAACPPALRGGHTCPCFHVCRPTATVSDSWDITSGALLVGAQATVAATVWELEGCGLEARARAPGGPR